MTTTPAIELKQSDKFFILRLAYLKLIHDIVEQRGGLTQQDFASKIWNNHVGSYQIWKNVRHVIGTNKTKRVLGMDEAMKMADFLGEVYEFLIVKARTRLVSGMYPELMSAEVASTVFP